MLRHTALMALIIAFSIPSLASATKLNGKIVVTKELREALADKESKARDPKLSGYWNEPNGVHQVAPPKVDPSSDLGIVIYREGAKAPEADKVKSVKVHTGSLEKNVVVIRPGTRIKFVSVDPYDHSLYSPELEAFGPEKQSRKAFRPIDFKDKGIYSVRCELLTNFEGWIVVSPATYVVEASSNGSFTMEDMEPGKYKIKVFLEGEWIHEQEFEIPEKGKEAKVEVKLEPTTASKKPAGKDEKKKDDEKKDDGKSK